MTGDAEELREAIRFIEARPPATVVAEKRNTVAQP
jgi:hypothetical protein